MTKLRIVTFGEVEASVLGYLTFVLPEFTGMRCRAEDTKLDLAHAYIAARHQHHSTRLLGVLKEMLQEPDELLLGVTEEDLCIPILTFVFGEALLDQSAAMLSFHRLRQPFYGLPEDQETFLRRAEKEALHELGHAAGLIHCRTYPCVMTFSNAVEQIDLKEPAFCEACRAQILRKWPKAPGL